MEVHSEWSDKSGPAWALPRFAKMFDCLRRCFCKMGTVVCLLAKTRGAEGIRPGQPMARHLARHLMQWVLP